MTVSSPEDDSCHSEFLNLCLFYGDFNRPAFLEAIRHWFIESASAAELKSLRSAIRDRAAALRRQHKKGRPRAEQSPAWISSTLKLVWMHDVEGKSWRKIASAIGLRPTDDNLRTLRNRRDHYAMLVWREVAGRGGGPEALSGMLESKHFQRLLRSKLALPFDSHPAECKKLVLAIAPRGLEAVSKESSRLPNRRTLP